MYVHILINTHTHTPLTHSHLHTAEFVLSRWTPKHIFSIIIPCVSKERTNKFRFKNRQSQIPSWVWKGANKQDFISLKSQRLLYNVSVQMVLSNLLFWRLADGNSHNFILREIELIAHQRIWKALLFKKL